MNRTSFTPLITIMLFLTSMVSVAQSPQLVCDFRPKDLTATNITSTSALLGWTELNGATLWELEIRPISVGFTSPNYTNVTNPALISGLTPGVEYKYRVRSVCAPGVYSGYSLIPLIFTTNITNPSSCQLKLAIPDNNCNTGHKNYNIEVNGVSGNQLGNNVILKEVNLIISHSWVRDIEAILVSPSGKTVLLTQQNGGSENNYGDPTDITCTKYTNFTEEDCNAKSIKLGAAPFIGKYFPEESFNKLYDGSDPNGIWTLKICDGAGGDMGRLEYVNLVFAPTLCTAPYDVKISNIGFNTAFVNWKATGNCTQTIIEIGPKGFTPGNNNTAGAGGTVFTANCPYLGPTQMTGLQQLTEYDVYLREDCGSGNFSANTCAYTFTTYCETHKPVSISEDFDSQALCNTCECGDGSSIAGIFENSTEGDYNWLVNEGPTPSYGLGTGPSGDTEGNGRYIYLETSGSNCQGGKKAILQSGCVQVDASNQDECHLSFFYHMRGATINKLEAYVTDNAGVNWNLVWNESGAKGNNWNRAYIDLTQWQGEVIQIRIVGYSGSGATGDIAIDRIEFYGSTFLGQPDKIFYADADNDGYGDINNIIKTCQNTPPPGFTADNEDCDDSKNSVHPGAPEVICNGIDENCNGIDDDKVLASVVVSGQNTCENNTDTLTVISVLKGDAYWFTSPTSSQAVYKGNPFITPVITANTVYYVMDSSSTYGCVSQRLPVFIQAFKEPLLATNDIPELCNGMSIDLADINVNDLKNAGGVFSFHTGFPATNSNVLSNSIITPVSTKIYYIKSTTANGCFDVLPVLVAVNPVPVVNIQNPGPIDLCPNSNAILGANTIGGTAPYQYLWSTGAPVDHTTVTGKPNPITDFYTVTVTDANSCTSSDVIQVNSIPGISNVSIVINDASTCTGTNGSIELTPPGSGIYNYFWSGPISGSFTDIQGGIVISNLKKGSYSITVTQQGNACSYIIPNAVINGPGAQLVASSVTDVSCAGLTNGKIDLTVLGTNLMFDWDDPNKSTTEDLIGVGPGFYSVTITDGVCNLILSKIQVKAPFALAVSGLTQSPACSGENTGSINLYVSGGIGPYTFLWNNNQTSEDLNGLGPGIFIATVTDANGCKQVSPVFQLATPNSLQIYSIQDNVNCYGGSDGVISISVLGGAPPYTYKWNDGPKVKDRAFLKAGFYKLTVTDHNGCSITTSNINLTQPDPLQVSINDISESTCKNLANGIIDINVSGGTLPYHFLWSNNFQGEDLTTALAGTYSVTVTDANACFGGTSDLKVITLDSLSLLTPVVTNAICNTLANGSISVTPVGGNGNYSYNWSSGPGGSTITNLMEGSYFVTVSDSKGCQAISKAIKVAQTSPISISVINLDIADCSTNQKGNIDISVFGKSPYTYKWSDGSMTEDLFGVINGLYSVTATDINGCKASLLNIDLTGKGNPFDVELKVHEAIKCPLDLNGKIVVNINGGQSPYQYNWSIGKEYDLESQTDTLTNLGASTYVITITDNKGCVVADTVQLTSPTEIDLKVMDIKNPFCKGDPQGHILLSGKGGNPPLCFIWETPKDTIFTCDPLLDSLGGGSYSVTVVDNKGCTATLDQPVILVEPPVGFEFDAVYTTGPTCTDAKAASISLFVKGGIGSPSYNWSIPAFVGPFVTGISGGTYSVTVTDDIGCAIDTTIFIEPYNPLKVQTTIVQDSVCDGDGNLIFLVITQGKGPYNIIWNNGDKLGYIDSLYPGTYSVMITDQMQCVYKDTFTVGVTGMVLDNVITKNYTNSSDKGTAEVFISQGAPPYKYLWDQAAGGATSSKVTGLLPGYYCVLVEDANGCKLTVCVEILGTVATNEPRKLNSFSVFPNPTSGIITLEDHSQSNYLTELVIRNQLGTEVVRMHIDFSKEKLQNISLETLPAGSYWLSIYNEKTTETILIIKQ